MNKPKVYQVIATALSRIRDTERRMDRGDDALEGYPRIQDIKACLFKYVRERMPSGSGLDTGVHLLHNSTENRLVFSCDFHHMDENGYYDGWTHHTFILSPSLQYGTECRVTGRDKNQIKDYIVDTLAHALTQEEATGQWFVERIYPNE